MPGEIRVAVCGAAGRVGREVVKGVVAGAGLKLVAAVDPACPGRDAGEVAGTGACGVRLVASLGEALGEGRPEVVVDFTQAAAATANAVEAIKAGVSPVIGTTGFTEAQLEQIYTASEERGVAAVIAPNFALGAVLMMQFARQAARYLPHVEIIELHHDQKADAPSGTALKTAQLIAEERASFQQGKAGEKELLSGARGADYQGFRIHSVRLPGLVASQEVIFGGQGQTLTIRHDTFSRDSFWPGVLLAITKVRNLVGVTYGLENLLD